MLRAANPAKQPTSSATTAGHCHSSSYVAEPTSANAQTRCKIIPVGKRRNGSARFWCVRHHADATEKYGLPAKKCQNSKSKLIDPEQVLTLDLDEYAGGIALWGAAPPVYDTTTLHLERGIHVHARPKIDGNKEIDDSFAAVRIIGSAVPKEGILISEADAVHFMTSSVFGVEMRHITCSHCGHPHLDGDWFSTHSHSTHLCGGCGRYFRDNRASVGNPICGVRVACGVNATKLKKAPDTLEIKQADYPGGIQVWGSSPALLWTSQSPERKGIHVHAFKADGVLPEIDETYSAVTIDGVKLDPQMVRVLMAQRTLPSLRSRIASINCPDCGAAIFEDGALAFTSQTSHECGKCGAHFNSTGRIRKTIGNPLVRILLHLAKYAPRAPQDHELIFSSSVQ